MPTPLKNKLKPLKVKESVPERLKRLRKLRGLTQEQLAQKIGITRFLIASYERGKNHLADEMIIRFAIALKVSTDKILGVENLSNENFASTRFTKRLKDLESLPERKKKAILSTLDDFIKANQQKSE